VDALVRHRFELPSLDTLTRLARRVHSQVNTAQWQRVGALLKQVERAALEALLVVDPTTQESPFALICRAPARKVERLETLFTAHGGREKLKEFCAQHLRHEKQNWRPFARNAFERLRSTLLRVADILPLQATAMTRDLLGFVSAVSNEEPPYSDYYLIENVEAGALPREWRGLVLDDPSNEKAFNRRQLEVVTMLELAAAIKAGEMRHHDEFLECRYPGDCARDQAGVSGSRHRRHPQELRKYRVQGQADHGTGGAAYGAAQAHAVLRRYQGRLAYHRGGVRDHGH
jgi:hypothetical protein